MEETYKKKIKVLKHKLKRYKEKELNCFDQVKLMQTFTEEQQ